MQVTTTQQYFQDNGAKLVVKVPGVRTITSLYNFVKPLFDGIKDDLELAKRLMAPDVLAAGVEALKPYIVSYTDAEGQDINIDDCDIMTAVFLVNSALGLYNYCFSGDGDKKK